jgi:diketogulonate reductase-like aldo/keto reductase
VVDLLGEIGERYSRSPAQVALRWLMEKERVLPIPGAKTGRQAASNAGALSFTLADAEIKASTRQRRRGGDDLAVVRASCRWASGPSPAGQAPG